MLVDHTRSAFVFLSYHLYEIYLLCINHTLFRSCESSHPQEKVLSPPSAQGFLEIARCKVILASLKMT